MGFKKLAMATAAAGFSLTAAHAADLGYPPLLAPPLANEFSGWYLRGNVGMTNQSVKSLTDTVAAGTTVTTHFLTFDSAPLFGGGAGYQVNNWLRLDGTAEYRGNAHFHGSQVATFGAIKLPDDYSASKSEWLFLANAYVDIGTWWGVTPFVGAGVGTTRNTIRSFTDIGATQVGATILSTTYGADRSRWDLAWALYAGLAYRVTPALSLELAYRYVNLGAGATGPTNSFDGVTVVNGAPFKFHDITSQDLMFGLRYDFGDPLVPVPALVRKG